MPEPMTGQPMEEILASIKRIIAEDAPLSLGPPTLGRNGASKDFEPEEDVLELDTPGLQTVIDPDPPVEFDTVAEAAPDPAFVVHEAPAPAPGESITVALSPDYVLSPPTLGTPEPEPTVTSIQPATLAQEAEAEPVAPLDPVILAAALDPEPAYESLLSASAEAASRQALAALNTLTIDARAAPNTLDGLVREMLRPMVKDWLDKNLPPLVEQLVANEIKRLGRG